MNKYLCAVHDVLRTWLQDYGVSSFNQPDLKLHAFLCVNSTSQVSSKNALFLWSMTHGLSNCSCSSTSFSLLLRKWEQSMCSAAQNICYFQISAWDVFLNHSLESDTQHGSVVFESPLTHRQWYLLYWGPSVQSVPLCILHPVCLYSVSQGKAQLNIQVKMLIHVCWAPSISTTPLLPWGWACLTSGNLLWRQVFSYKQTFHL